MTDDTAAAARYDLDAFLAMPRVAGLALSPDGRRLVTTATIPDAEGTGFTTALWAIDPSGDTPPRRLTRSGKGEAAPAIAADGSLLFTSARPGPDDDDDGEPVARLWRLPADGGEAVVVAAPPAGVRGVAVARDVDRVVLTTALHPDAKDFEADAEREKARTDAKVTAQLLTDFPVRFWDHWLGPREVQLYAAAPAAVAAAEGDDTPAPERLTTAAGNALKHTSVALSDDGRTLVWTRRPKADDLRDWRAQLVTAVLDADGSPGEERVLRDEPFAAYSAPVISPDGATVAVILDVEGTPDAPGTMTVLLVDLTTGEARDLTPDFDRWPSSLLWAPDGTALYLTADDDGSTPAYRLDVTTGAITRLAAIGTFSDLQISPDGATLYAVHGHLDTPHHVVALDPHEPDQEPRPLPSPTSKAAPPGRVERVETTAGDGARVPGWLVLPPEGETDGPAPLAVFIHGGPLSTWAGWHWRWNAQLFAARGWAVLLPDPGLSTGYGQAQIARGWGRWGAEPYTDIISLVDAVEARRDIDASRTAALGGSFGGYMANWVAGHTDRFDAIMTHASLWNLKSFHGPTDHGPLWENQFGDPYADPSRYIEWSPHRFVDRITTPMLVIHGEKDYRVPVSEGLTLWTDLKRHGVEAQYLHFPDENHWIAKPRHIRVWYETVFAFLDHHVLGKPWRRPELL